MSMELAIKISAINQAAGALTDVTKQVETLQSTIEKSSSLSDSFNQLGANLTSVGQDLTTKLTLPIVGAGAAILKVAGDFQYSMNRVGALTRATADEFVQLEDLARKMGSTTQYSASESADAMGFLAMAGFEVVEIMDSLEGVLQLAAAGQVDLARAADISSNILASFGMEAKDLGKVNDILAFTLSNQNVTLETLAETMKYVAPVANSLGFSLEEVSAAAGILGGAGIQGSQAGTALRASLARLAAPPSTARDALERLNITVRDSSGEMKTLAEIMGELYHAGADIEDLKDLFGMEALGAMSVLLKHAGEDIADFTNRIREDGPGTAEFLADASMQGLVGATKEFTSALEGLSISIAKSGLMDFAEGLVRGVTKIVSGLSNLDPNILKTITIIAGIAAVVGPVLIAMGTLFKVIALSSAGWAAFATKLTAVKLGLAVVAAKVGVLALPLLAIAGAIAVSALLIYKNWATVSTFFSGFANGFLAEMQPVFETLQKFASVAASAFSSIATAIKSFSSEQNEAAEGAYQLGEQIGRIAGFVVKILAVFAAFKGILIAVGATIAAVKSAFLIVASVVTAVKVAFAAFGAVVSSLGAVFAILKIAFVAIGAVVAAVGLPVILAIAAIAGAAALIYFYWEPIKAFFIDLFARIKAGFQSAKEFIAETWTSISTSASNAIQGIREKIQSAVTTFENLRARVLEVVSNLASRMMEAGRNLIIRLVEGIKSQIEMVVNIIKGITQRIRNLLPGSDAKEGPLSDLGASGRALFATFARGINGNPLLSIVGSVLGQTGKIISGAATTFSALAKAVNAGMSTAAKIVKDKIAEIISIVVSLAKPVLNAMTSTMERLLSAMRTGMTQAVGLMQQLGKQLVTTLLSFSDQFFNAGKTLMDRFNAGISANINSSMQLMTGAALPASGNLLRVPTPPRGGIGRLPPPPPLPTLPPPPPVGGPSGLPPGGSPGNTGGIEITYAPTINGGANSADLMETLRQHSRELAQLVEDAIAKRDRARYA